MKICFVSHWSGSGGAEKVLYRIVSLCRERGIEVVCVVPRQGSLYRKFVELGVPTYLIGYRWWMGKDISLIKRIGRNMLNPLLAVAIARIIRKEGCDLVYTNTSTIHVGALAAWLARRRHLWHIHEYGFEHGGMTYDLGIVASTKLMGWLSDRVITVSEGVRRKYIEYIQPNKVVTIYNPIAIDVDVVPEIRVKPERFRVSIVGSLSEGKGQEQAIRAVAMLKGIGVNSELLVIGDGDDLEYKLRIRELVIDLDVQDNVDFRGQLGDPYPAMKSSDCVLICSKFEGFATVVIEGMLLNRLVVAARSGSVPEQIVHDLTGLMYEEGNVESLAELLKSVYEDPARASRIAANGCAWARREFTVNRFFGRLSAVIGEPGSKGLDRSSPMR